MMIIDNKIYNSHCGEWIRLSQMNSRMEYCGECYEKQIAELKDENRQLEKGIDELNKGSSS